MPVFPHIETSQLICTANQLTGFYLRATLVLNGWMTQLSLSENDLLHNIMYGDKNFDMNIRILTATIKFIRDSDMFGQLREKKLFNDY